MEHIGPMRRVRPDRSYASHPSYASHATHQSYSVGGSLSLHRCLAQDRLRQSKRSVSWWHILGFISHLSALPYRQ